MLTTEFFGLPLYIIPQQDMGFSAKKYPYYLVGVCHLDGPRVEIDTAVFELAELEQKLNGGHFVPLSVSEMSIRELTSGAFAVMIAMSSSRDRIEKEKLKLVDELLQSLSPFAEENFILHGDSSRVH